MQYVFHTLWRICSALRRKKFKECMKLRDSAVPTSLSLVCVFMGPMVRFKEYASSCSINRAAICLSALPFG